MLRANQIWQARGPSQRKSLSVSTIGQARSVTANQIAQAEEGQASAPDGVSGQASIDSAAAPDAGSRGGGGGGSGGGGSGRAVRSPRERMRAEAQHADAIDVEAESAKAAKTSKKKSILCKVRRTKSTFL